MIRVMVPDYANYQQIQALQSLALEIRNKHLPLHIAEQRVEKIFSQPKWHSPLLICAFGGLIVGVDMRRVGFRIGGQHDRILRFFAGQRCDDLPEFLIFA